MQGDQPGDEEKGPHRPAGHEPPARRAERDPDQHGAAAPLEATGELEILQDAEGLVAAHPAKHRGANEDPLVPVVVAGEAVADPVDPGDEAEDRGRLREEVLEGAARNPRVRQGCADQPQGLCRREGVGVEEVEATYDNGVLEVTVPRPAAPEKKAVNVSIK